MTKKYTLTVILNGIWAAKSGIVAKELCFQVCVKFVLDRQQEKKPTRQTVVTRSPMTHDSTTKWSVLYMEQASPGTLHSPISSKGKAWTKVIAPNRSERIGFKSLPIHCTSLDSWEARG